MVVGRDGGGGREDSGTKAVGGGRDGKAGGGLSNFTLWGGVRLTYCPIFLKEEAGVTARGGRKRNVMGEEKTSSVRHGGG